MSARLEEIVFSAAERRRNSIVLITLALWSVAIGSASWSAQANPSVVGRFVVGVLILLAVVSYLPAGVSIWRRSKNRERLAGMFQSDRYLSEIKSVPSKGDFLAEVAKEMTNAQRTGDPCTLVVAGFSSFETIRATHGDRIAHRAVEELGSKLVRAARGSDPIGYLGEGVFATLLLDCLGEHSRQFMRRLPLEMEFEDALGRTYGFTVHMCGLEYDRREESPAAYLSKAFKGPIRIDGPGAASSRVA